MGNFMWGCLCGEYKSGSLYVEMYVGSLRVHWISFSNKKTNKYSRDSEILYMLDLAKFVYERC